MKKVPLAKVKDDLSSYLRRAEHEEVVITRHGRPAGVLIGFHSDEDWFEYQLEHNPEFLRRIAEARASLRRGEGVRIEAIDLVEKTPAKAVGSPMRRGGRKTQSARRAGGRAPHKGARAARSEASTANRQGHNQRGGHQKSKSKPMPAKSAPR